MDASHAVRELLEAYKRYNAWEIEERRRTLPQLTLAEGLQQYFELQNLAEVFAPNAEAVFLNRQMQYWMATHASLSRAAEYFANAAAIGSAQGS